MTVHNVNIKAYEEKIVAQLQQARAQITELEARAKSDVKSFKADLLKDVKARSHEIEKKLQELKTTGAANAEQVKADIDAKLEKMKGGLTELAGSIKKHAQAS